MNKDLSRVRHLKFRVNDCVKVISDNRPKRDMETSYVDVTTPLDQIDFLGFLILLGVRRYEAHRILRDRINDNRDRRKEKALRDRRRRPSLRHCYTPLCRPTLQQRNFNTWSNRACTHLLVNNRVITECHVQNGEHLTDI